MTPNGSEWLQVAPNMAPKGSKLLNIAQNYVSKELQMALNGSK